MKKRGGLAEWQDQNSPRNEQPASGADDNAPLSAPRMLVSNCNPRAVSRPLQPDGSSQKAALPVATTLAFPLPAFASLDQDAGIPIMGSNVDPESRMEAAALVEELSSLKGMCNHP
jgi:hypothetical protein